MVASGDPILGWLRMVSPETLPPEPVEEHQSPVNGLTLILLAIPAVGTTIALLAAGPSAATWISVGASWAALGIALLVRLRHLVHLRLQRHLYDLKSGLYTYYLMTQGVPRPEPDSAPFVDQHFPDARKTIHLLRQTIAPDASGHFPSRDLQHQRMLRGEFYAVLFEVRRLGRLHSSCDRCRWCRLLDRMLAPLPLPE